MLKKINFLVLTGFLLMFLTNCGFHFAGKYKLPEYLNQVVIYPLDDIKSDFYLKLKNVLENNEIKVLSLNAVQDLKLKQNVSVLHIAIPVIKEKVHSYNSQGQITNNMLTASCDYKLFDHANSMIQKNVISRSRTYGVNNNQLLSNLGERQIIVQELQLEIINELLRQLSVDMRVHKNAKK